MAEHGQDQHAASSAPTPATMENNADISNDKGRSGPVDEAEVYYLIADFLKRRTNCQRAADTLIEELQEHALLRESVDWQGRKRPATYTDFSLRHRDLSSGHLMHLLQSLDVVSQSNEKKSPVVNSLLLKSRGEDVTKVSLSPDERKALGKGIVEKNMQLRQTNRTLETVRSIVSKYDRIREYAYVHSVNELPASIQLELENSVQSAEALTSLAADVRALKQLLQLQEQKKTLGVDFERSILKAQKAGMLQSHVRSGRNQVSLLQQRELGLRGVDRIPRPPSPPTYIYSRIRRVKTLNGHLQIPTYCLTYDRTCQYVITGADDRLIKIWSLRTGELRFTLRGHLGNITDLAVNYANTLLASSSDDKTVRVWELSTGAPVAVLLGHSSVVNSLRFHPTKNVVVTASDDGRCFCYRLPDIEKVEKHETWHETATRLHAQGAYMLSLHPEYTLSHSDGRLGVRSCKVLCLSFSRCGNYVITGGQDGIGRVWDVSVLSDPNAPAVVPQYRPERSPQPAQVERQDRVVEMDNANQLAAPGEELPIPAQPVQLVNRHDDAPPAQNNEPDGAAGPQEDLNQNDGQNAQLPNVPAHPRAPNGAVDESDVPRLPNSTPVALLKGHTGPITNIVFSNRGNRVATASIKDGTARVWKWTGNGVVQSSGHQVLIAKTEQPSEFSVRRKQVPAVDTLTWTRDDSRLVTLHSVKPGVNEPAEADWQQRLRVWNPYNGDLLITLAAVDREKLQGHVNAVFALDVHPDDWRIVVTAGYDGRIFLWDIESGRVLKKFVNTTPDGEILPLLDGGFMPTGEGFCFTDRSGRLLLFSAGSRDQFAATPVQQYFQSDYAEIVTDGHFHVYDRETQTEPSRMPSGPLVDVYRAEYPYQPPHLLEQELTPEAYEENRRLRIRQAAESEEKCGVQLEADDENADEVFPVAILKEQVEENPRPDTDWRLANASYRLDGEPVTLADLKRRKKSRVRRRQNSTSLEDRDTSILNVEISSDDDNDEDFQAPAVGDEEDEDDELDDVDTDDLLSSNDEEEMLSPPTHRRGRLRRRISRQDRRRVSEEEHVGNRQLRRARRQARRIIDSDEDTSPADEERPANVPSEDDAVVVETNDGFIMGDNQLDKFDTSITYDEMLSQKQSQLGTDRPNVSTSEGLEPLIPCALCNEGDDGNMFKLPGDAMGIHPLLAGSQRYFVHDQCAIASPRSFHRDGKWYNVLREVRRGRSLKCDHCTRRGATIGCTIQSCSRSYHWKCAVNCGWSIQQSHFYCPQHESHAQVHPQGEQPQSRFGMTFHREWLQRAELDSSHQYVPQLGDYIVYFPEGHGVYLKLFPQMNTGWERLVGYSMVKCRVAGIKYVFPKAEEVGKSTTIKTELTLTVLALPSEDGMEVENDSNVFHYDSRTFKTFDNVNAQLNVIEDGVSSDRFMFTLLFHAHDVANFLVLDHVYENGVYGEWLVGERVQMPYVQMDDSGFETDSKLTYGTITDILTTKRVNDELRITPWECITVKWDDPEEESCAVSPWELDPIIPMRQERKQALDYCRRSQRLVRHRAITGEKREALTRELETVLGWEIATDFATPVTDSYLDYLITVANPVDLRQILQRVENGYYRQPEAFASDVLLLCTNCEQYNVPDSSIAQNARSVSSTLLTQAQRHFPHLVTREGFASNPRTSLVYPPDDVPGVDDPNELFEVLPEIPDKPSTQEVLELSALQAPPDIQPEPVAENEVQDDAQVAVEDTVEEEEEPLAQRTRRSLRQSSNSSTSVAEGRGQTTDEVEETEGAVKKEEQKTARARRAQERQREEEADEEPITETVAGPPINERALVSFPMLMAGLTNDQKEKFREACREDLAALLHDFHEAVMGADQTGMFMQPVTDDIAPNYSQIISRPMDFGTINDRLSKFRSFKEYFALVELVFQNAIHYNTWDSFVAICVSEIQECFPKFLLDAIGAEVPPKKQRKVKEKVSSGNSRIKQKRAQPTVPKRNAMKDFVAEDDSWSSEEDEEEEEEEENESESSEEDWSDDDEEVIGKRRRNTNRGRVPPKKPRRY